MALFPFSERRNNFWDAPDPFDLVVSVFDNTPASSFARDAHAVASTNVDWKETPTEHVFKADLPGLKKEEVQVQVEDGRTLSISGQRKKEEVQKTDTWHRVERSSGQFMRKFRLPENAKLDHITAKVENGVLTVVVPKEEKQRPKTRSIAVGGHDGIHGDANQGSFCAKAISNYNTSGSCPKVSTFDIIDTAAYAGVWYELGSTALFKLSSEAGLDCLQANYTLQVSNATTSLVVVNSGRRSLGPVATLGVTSISTGAKDVCMSARDVCEYLGPPSGMMQSVSELRRIASIVRKELPDQATILDDVAQNMEGYGSSISKEFTMVAEHVQIIQKLDGYLSAGNNSTTANVEQIKLEITEICKHIDTLAMLVDEMATVRSLLGQAVVKLLLAGEFVSTVDVTEASALIGAAEQSILLRADRMKASLRAMSSAAQVLVADSSVSYRNISWSLPGVGTQNVTNKGRLEFSILGVTAPYNIIALEGLPSKGYEAALVYSCTENHVLGTIQQAFFVLSRRPTLLPATLNRFLGVAASLGADLDCENPFLTSGCNCAPFVESCSHWTP